MERFLIFTFEFNESGGGLRDVKHRLKNLDDLEKILQEIKDSDADCFEVLDMDSGEYVEIELDDVFNVSAEDLADMIRKDLKGRD